MSWIDKRDLIIHTKIKTLRNILLLIIAEGSKMLVTPLIIDTILIIWKVTNFVADPYKDDEKKNFKRQTLIFIYLGNKLNERLLTCFL